jgi:hypothetical protein
VLLERLRLELRDGQVDYYAIARGQNNNEAIKFRLTQADYDGYVFENPAHDDPKKIRYLLLGNREIQVFTEGTRNGRTVKQEYIFEREFNTSSVEFRIRGGINGFRLNGTGQFPSDSLGKNQDLGFGFRPGWEIGASASFNGRGGFLRVHFGIDLMNKHSAVASNFPGDTVLYVRDGAYSTTWLSLSVIPEFRLKRDGRFSFMAGPYISRLMGSRLNGDIRPDNENKLFKANNDFKKTDIGLNFGFQYALNIGKKDLGGILGLRGSLGLSDLDNLYNRDCNNPAFCNGQVKWQGVSLYYSLNLLKL